MAFDNPSHLRFFALFVGADAEESGQRPLFVNPYSFCEMSQIFDSVCFDFDDKRQCMLSKALIETNVSIQQVEKALTYLFPDDNYASRREITKDNLAALIVCGRELGIPSILRDIEMFMEDQLLPEIIHNFPVDVLVEAVLEIQITPSIRPSALERVYKKIASWGRYHPEKVIRKYPREIGDRLFQAVNQHMPKWIRIGPSSPATPAQRLFF